MKITGKEKTKEKESRSRRKADYLSVYDLFLRSGGCKVGIVIALTLLAEAITLVVLMQGETMYYENLFARDAALPVGIGFLLLTLALLDPLRAQKSNVDYTIRRLHIRPLDVFWVETVYVLLAYFVFWALNVTLLYACGAYFTSHISTAANREMGLLLAFVRTPQLYVLLPVMNVTLWIRNITGVLALSACIARYSYFARKNQNKTILVFISVVLLVGSHAYVSGTEASGNLLVAAFMACCFTAARVSVSAEEKEPEEDPAASSKNGRKKKNAERMVEDAEEARAEDAGDAQTETVQSCDSGAQI